MKLKFLISLFTTIISLNLTAQFKGLEYGIKAGINVSSVNETGNSWRYNYRSLIGGVGGAFVTLPISHNFFIQPELLYTQMGFQNKYNEPFSENYPNNYNVMNHLSYLNISILAKYKIMKTKISVLAGPQIGFLLSANEKATGYYSLDVKSDYKNSDFSGVFGVEYTLPYSFIVSARYQLGLLNTNLNSYITDKNRALAFTLAYGFGKKKRK